MLGKTDAVATIAVKDIKAAGKFYGGTLGFQEVPTGEEGVLNYKSGNASVLVYESQYAGTNKATAATWMVGGELERLVRDLKARGVFFEHYDLPGTTRKGDIHDAGSTRVAWFKDPDGNILALVSE
jgi:catechol 2,3-dioxygenase-like lactoylglutathione lyase family enzyme